MISTDSLNALTLMEMDSWILYYFCILTCSKRFWSYMSYISSYVIKKKRNTVFIVAIPYIFKEHNHMEVPLVVKQS